MREPGANDLSEAVFSVSPREHSGNADALKLRTPEKDPDASAISWVARNPPPAAARNEVRIHRVFLAVTPRFGR